jgi:hypothetical protein
VAVDWLTVSNEAVSNRSGHRARCPVVVGAGALEVWVVAGDEVAAGESFVEFTGILPPQKMANSPSTRKTAARAPPTQTQLPSGSLCDDGVLRSIIFIPPESNHL